MTRHEVLHQPMTAGATVHWAGATWIGQLDERVALDSAPRDKLRLAESAGYRRARLLITAGSQVRGFIEVPVSNGLIDLSAVHRRVALLPPAAEGASDRGAASFTVIICTRDRPEQLRTALTSVLALDYPSFDVVVVDNAPATDATSALVGTEFADPRIRLITEPKPGVSAARNAGLIEATGTFVAFTDDDVVVDSGWLRALAAGFARDDAIDCVTGLVPSGELRTPVQAYFDAKVSWSNNLEQRVFTLAEPPADLPMFPFSVGQFGTGANFAMRAERVLALGGFDTAFGVGTRTAGGEDLDIFTRVLLAGGGLAVEPNAIVWHRHRSDVAALELQARGYGTGLGSWLTKIVLQPRLAVMVLRRAPMALRHLIANARTTTSLHSDDVLTPVLARIGRVELASVLLGPWLYAQQRFAGEGLMTARRQSVPQRVGTAASRFASAGIVALRAAAARLSIISVWERLAVAAGLAGVLASAEALPGVVQGLLVASVVLLGPGSVVRSWVRMPRSATLIVVPAVGIAAVILATCTMLAVHAWMPREFLIVLALTVIILGVLPTVGRVLAARMSGEPTTSSVGGR